MPPPDQRVVLRGPRSPPWSCGCGRLDNWASRIKCVACGRAAPQRILAQARKADAAAGSALAPASRGQARPAAGDRMQAQLAALQQKIDGLLAAQPEQRSSVAGSSGGGRPVQPPGDGSVPGSAPADPALEGDELDLDKLVRAHRAMADLFGPEHAEAVRARKLVEEAQRKRQDSKPLHARALQAQRKVERCRKAREASTAHVATLRAELAAAEDAAANALGDLEKAEADLLDLRKQALEDAGGAALPDSAPAAVRALFPKDFVFTPEQAAHLEAVSAILTQAVDHCRQAPPAVSAEPTAAPAAPPAAPTGPASPVPPAGADAADASASAAAAPGPADTDALEDIDFTNLDPADQQAFDEAMGSEADGDAPGVAPRDVAKRRQDILKVAKGIVAKQARRARGELQCLAEGVSRAVGFDIKPV